MSSRTPFGLTRIARETVQERVYCTLRDQLMRGGFEPGQKLKIAELAEAFGTSAMPVREALNRLAVERALETLPSRTVRVPALSKATLQDLRETRFAVEGLAIERAASNMTAGSLATLRQLIAVQSAARNKIVHFTSRSTANQVRLSYCPSSRVFGCSSVLICGRHRSFLMAAMGAVRIFTSRCSMRCRAGTASRRARRSKPT
jgi:DNA-binding GntR family transcriptional regulator